MTATTGITKSYVATSFGQVHVRLLAARRATSDPPLVCLHPAPSSGLYFTTAMPLLNDSRNVLAPDYPGYGGSDPLPQPASIADYAKAMHELLYGLGLDEPVDVLGFHTGCLVAVEMARRNDAHVRRLVLCDVPYFETPAQRELRDKFARPMPVSGDLDCLATTWAFDVGGRIGHVPLDRAFELFAEHLRAGRKDYFAFAAAFSYDCAARFSGLDADTVVLATQSGLRDASHAAAAAIPNARHVDVDEVTTAVFEEGAPAIARRIQSALGE